MLALQQQRAQGRRERERDDAGQRDRDGHGDGELLIELAGDAAEERDRNEHRTEHQHDGHDGTGDLAHRFDGGFLRRHLVVPHQALDVFEHDNRIVDDDADRQHHGEQRQGVDREAEQPESGEGTDQRNRHGNQRNQRGAPVLEEDEDDDGNHHQRFGQRLEHFRDRCLDELGGVEGNDIVHPRREFRAQFVHAGAYALGHFQRVGAGLQIDADSDDRLAQQLRACIVALRAEFDAGDILEVERAFGTVGAHDDVAEFCWCRQAALGGDGVDQLLALRCGFLADLAGGVLLVLRGDGIRNVGGRDAELRHALGLEPDPHRVVQRAEDLGVTDTRKPAQLVKNVDQGVVGQIERRQAVVGRTDCRDHQDVVRALGNGHPVLADDVRQARFGDLDPVVDVHRGHVDVGADFEGGGDRQAAVRLGRRVEIDQVLDTRELFLDGAGDCFCQCFGRSARVGG